MSDQEQGKKTRSSKVPTGKGRKRKQNSAELVLEISHKVAIADTLDDQLQIIM